MGIHDWVESKGTISDLRTDSNSSKISKFVVGAVD